MDRGRDAALWAIIPALILVGLSVVLDFLIESGLLPSSMTWQDWKAIGDIVLGLATVTIAFGVAAISYQNHITARDNLRLALFEKRFEAYENVRKYVATISQLGRVDHATEPGMLKAMHESEFLFGPEVRTYLNEIWNAATAMESSRKSLDGGVVDKQRKEHEEAERKWKTWLNAQLGSLQRPFAPYLRFDVKAVDRPWWSRSSS